MSIFEIFDSGARHRREQQEFDKVRVIEGVTSGADLDRRHDVDLARGVALIRPRRPQPPADEPRD